MTKNHKKKRKTNNLWLIDIRVDETINEEVTRTPETTNIDDHEEKILSWNKKINENWPMKQMHIMKENVSGAVT